jgi:hypothetical protein
VRKLLTLLLHKEELRWWTLKETEHGEPSAERVYMFHYPQIITAIKQKLAKWSTHEIDS